MFMTPSVWTMFQNMQRIEDSISFSSKVVNRDIYANMLLSLELIFN